MMQSELQKTYSWTIDNFSETIAPMKSPRFISDGCEWHVLLHPKGDKVDDHLSLYLTVSNPKSLKPGWKRQAGFGFSILNQSGKELYKTSEGINLFTAEVPGWGFRKAVPLSKLLDMENNTLIIDVYTKVYEIVNEGDKTNKQVIEIGGFQVLASQVISVSEIHAKHPNFAVDIAPTSKAVKAAYMNILLGLNETLHKPVKEILDTELVNAQDELNDLEEVGFKLGWLHSKLKEIRSERIRLNCGWPRIQELEESVRNMEQMLWGLRRTLSREKEVHSGFNRRGLLSSNEDDDDDVCIMGDNKSMKTRPWSWTPDYGKRSEN